MAGLGEGAGDMLALCVLDLSGVEKKHRARLKRFRFGWRVLAGRSTVLHSEQASAGRSYVVLLVVGVSGVLEVVELLCCFMCAILVAGMDVKLAFRGS